MRCTNCGKRMKKTVKDYHYTECGLDNVILKDLTMYVCTCGEEGPLIPHVNELHKVIALLITKITAPLEGQEIKFLRKEMGLKAKELANILDVSPITISRWETGQADIGSANDRLLRLLFIRDLEGKCEQFIDQNMREIFKNIREKRHIIKKVNIPVNNIPELLPCQIQ